MTTGNYTLFQLSQIALKHLLKIPIPPSVLIGFGEKNRLMYNDDSGAIKVKKDKYLSITEVQDFMNDKMRPRPLKTRNALIMIPPRYIIKLINSDSSSDTSVYYCLDTLISDVNRLWGKCDIIIQSYIVTKSFRPSIYSLYRNDTSVYRAECRALKEAIKDNKYKMHLLDEICKVVQEDEKRDLLSLKAQRDREKKKPPKGPNVAFQSGYDSKMFELKDDNNMEQLPSLIKRTSTLKLHQSDGFKRSISMSEVLGEELKVKKPVRLLNEVGLPIEGTQKSSLVFFAERQQQIANGTCTVEPTIVAKTQKALFLKIQGLFAIQDTTRMWAIVAPEDGQPDSSNLITCRPDAFPQAVQTTNQLYHLFSQKYVNKKQHGDLTSFVCDFVEDENGVEIFLKVKDFKISGPLPHHASWQTSQSFKTPVQINYIPPPCQVNLMCNSLKFGYQIFQISEDFEAVCKELQIWKFQDPPKEQQHRMAQVSSRNIYLYNMEMNMAADSFTRESEKAGLSPFFPLTCFPDRNHAEYHIYDLQQRSSNNILQKMNFHEIQTQFVDEKTKPKFGDDQSDGLDDFLIGDNFQAQKVKAKPKLKKIETISLYRFKSKKEDGTDLRKQAFNILLADDENQIMVDEQGQIVLIESPLVWGCRHCAMLIELYTYRHITIIFKSQIAAENLKKMKFKNKNDWDKASINQLILLYKKEAYTQKKKDLPTTQWEEKKRKLQQQVMKVINTPLSIRNPDRHTASSQKRVQYQLDYRRELQYSNALMKTTKFRDSPAQITQRDWEHLSAGPVVPTNYGSFRYFSTTAKSTHRPASTKGVPTTRRSLSALLELSEQSRSAERKKKKFTRHLQTINALNRSIEESLMQPAPANSDCFDIQIPRMPFKRSASKIEMIPEIPESPAMQSEQKEKLTIQRPLSTKIIRRIASAKQFAKEQKLESNPLKNLMKEQIMSNSLPKFRLKIKNFERALLPQPMQPIINKVQKIEFNARLSESPYVKGFQEMGLKLKKIKHKRKQTGLLQSIEKLLDRALPIVHPLRNYASQYI